jgi:APA family basic amino acid/polyamine antiporter
VNHQTEENSKGLIKGLDLTSATTIVVGSMIGSGIFIAPSLMAGYVKSPGMILLLWIIGGLFTVFGAMSYSELCASMPKAGGQYVFLKQAYSPAIGFLYGWTVFLVIQTGFIAAVAVAFAKYLGVFIPCLSENVILFSMPLFGKTFAINSAQIVGMISIAVLTAINCFGIKTGAIVQNIFTFLKVGAVLVLVVLGFASSKGSAANMTPFFSTAMPDGVTLGLFAALAVALSKALFAYDAWNTVTFTAEEVCEPHTNLPKALILGSIITTIVYTSATAVYFYLVPVDRAASVPDNRIAAEAAQILFGNAGLYFISAAVLISTFGCNNGLILGGPRVYYAMAKDGLFFKNLAHLHPVYRTPVHALILQGVWSCVLTLTGSYSDLLTYIAFASVLFNAMTIVSLYIMRRKHPNMERPHMAMGYPVVPALYLLIAAAFLIFILQGDFWNSIRGLCIIIIGIPVYFYFNRNNKTSQLSAADDPGQEA